MTKIDFTSLLLAALVLSLLTILSGHSPLLQDFLFGAATSVLLIIIFELNLNKKGHR